MDNSHPNWIMRALNMLQNERGEVLIPFLETVPEESRTAVESLVTNLGATTEDLAGFKTFDEFASGYKPKAPAAFPGGWKKTLGSDISNSPTLQKFEDTPEGLKKAVESHLNLEKLLGNEKIPLPKDANDKEGWVRFNKAMGVPDKPDGYGLEDAKIPESMKSMAFDKAKFSEVVHSQHLTPAQAKGLWAAYTQMSQQVYQSALKAHQAKLDEVVNTLRQEWGDAYDSNVDLGQLVINKFSGDAETEEFLTASLTKDPRFVKFLASIGQQFAENKIGEFKLRQFAMSPDEAEAELSSIRLNPQHPYNNEKASAKDRQAAIEYVNRLIGATLRTKE